MFWTVFPTTPYPVIYIYKINTVQASYSKTEPEQQIGKEKTGKQKMKASIKSKRGKSKKKWEKRERIRAYQSSDDNLRHIIYKEFTETETNTTTPHKTIFVYYMCQAAS